MTGPEHYQKAEELLKAARDAFAQLNREFPDAAVQTDAAIHVAPVVTNAMAQAQVHATLALVASNVNRYHSDDSHLPDWSEALS